MVNWDNETTVATPPGEVVKIVILERREQVIEAIENYYTVEGVGIDTQLKVHTLRARVLALWYQLEAMAYRRLKDAKGGAGDPTYDMVEAAMKIAKGVDDLVELFKWMNRFIDDMGLTYIDARARYDRRNVEDANQKKGM